MSFSRLPSSYPSRLFVLSVSKCLFLRGRVLISLDFPSFQRRSVFFSVDWFLSVRLSVLSAAKCLVHRGRVSIASTFCLMRSKVFFSPLLSFHCLEFTSYPLRSVFFLRGRVFIDSTLCLMRGEVSFFPIFNCLTVKITLGISGGAERRPLHAVVRLILIRSLNRVALAYLDGETAHQPAWL